MVDLSYVIELWGVVTKSGEYLSQLVFASDGITDAMRDAQQDRNAGLKIIGVALSILGTVFIFLLRTWAFFKNKMARSLADPEKMWKKRPSFLQEDIYRDRKKKGSIPILTLANFKGGSGKTMIAANLAAYFDSLGIKVLLIDFDAHGSLSDLVGGGKDQYIGKSSFLLERQKSLSCIPARKIPFLDEEKERGFKNTWLYDAGKELSRSENSILLKWISGQTVKSSPDKQGMSFRVIEWFNFAKRTRNLLWKWWYRGALDLRFNTFNYLREPEIQKEEKGGYDIVIIDTPSQLTPAFVNAFCATTHLLVPTTADSVSITTTLESCNIFQSLRESLGLDFRTLSIIPSITQESGRLVPREEESLRKLARNINKEFGDSIIEGDLNRMDRAKRKKYKKDLPAMEQDYKGLIWEDRRVPRIAGILDEEGRGNLTLHHRQPARINTIKPTFEKLGNWLIEEFDGAAGEVLKKKLYDARTEVVNANAVQPFSPQASVKEVANEVANQDEKKKKVG